MSPLIYQKKKVPTCSHPVYFEDQPVTEICVCVCVCSVSDWWTDQVCSIALRRNTDEVSFSSDKPADSSKIADKSLKIFHQFSLFFVRLQNRLPGAVKRTKTGWSPDLGPSLSLVHFIRTNVFCIIKKISFNFNVKYETWKNKTLHWCLFINVMSSLLVKTAPLL